MVIKSKTRKDASFSQLVNYILRETRQEDGHQQEEEAPIFTILHNFDDAIMPDNMDGIAQDFLQNSKHLKARKNGVVMYHEIASFAPEDASKIDRTMLEQLTRKYIEVRAKNAMVLARPHFDKKHLHIHFLISGNERGNSRKMRVSKQEFQEQRRAIEEFQLTQYPELNQSYVHSRDKAKFKQERIERKSEKTRAMEERGAKQTTKMQLSKKVQAAMSGAQNIDTLRANVEGEGLQVYLRSGVAYGIIENNKRYRFKTLLKGTDYETQIDLMLANERELQKARQRLLKLKGNSATQSRKRKR